MSTADYEIKYDSNSRPLLIGGRTNLYMQNRYINAVGTYRTDKFGHWISRSRGCEIVLDGMVIQTEHPGND